MLFFHQALQLLIKSGVRSAFISTLTAFSTFGILVSTMRICSRDAKMVLVIECIYSVEQFSIECRETKTKVITLTNHKRCRQSNEPIGTQSKYM